MRQATNLGQVFLSSFLIDFEEHKHPITRIKKKVYLKGEECDGFVWDWEHAVSSLPVFAQILNGVKVLSVIISVMTISAK